MSKRYVKFLITLTSNTHATVGGEDVDNFKPSLRIYSHDHKRVEMPAKTSTATRIALRIEGESPENQLRS